MGARAYRYDNMPIYNKNSNRMSVFIQADHPVSNPDRPYYSEDKDAAQSLLAHIEGVLTGTDRRAASAYWNELNQIVKNGYGVTEQAQAIQKRNDQLSQTSLNDSGDILNTRQTDALYIYSVERGLMRKDLSPDLNVQERATVVRTIHNMAVNNAYGVQSSTKGLAPKIARVVEGITQTEGYKTLAQAVSVINNDIGQSEDVMDIAPLTSDTRFENELNDDDFTFDDDDNEGRMTNEVRLQRLERILRSAPDIDLDGERHINIDNIRLAQAHSNLINQIQILEEGGENDAARAVRARIVSPDRLFSPISENLTDDAATLANAIISSPAYKAFSSEVQARLENKESYKSILATATASENDPLSRLDIIMATRQESQVISHVLDAVSMNGTRLPEPDRIRAITAQIRDDLSVAIYKRAPSQELNNYPKTIPQVDEEGKRFSVPHPYWEQYASGNNKSTMTDSLRHAQRLALHDHGSLMKEKKTLSEKTDRTEAENTRLALVQTIPASSFTYLRDKVGYVPLDNSSKAYEGIALATSRLLYAPTFGEESHKLKFNTVTMEAARYYKNGEIIDSTVKNVAETNKTLKANERTSIIMVKDEDHPNKEKIAKAAAEAGMPIIVVFANQTAKNAIDTSSGVPRKMTIRENHLTIDTQDGPVSLYSSEGQKLARGALVLIDPKGVEGPQRSMIGWQISQSLSRETLVFGINQKDYNVCQQIRRSIELNKPTTVLDEKGLAMKNEEVYAEAKEGAPRMADNNRPSRIAIAEYNEALDWKLNSNEGKLFMTRVVGYDNALKIAESYKAIDKVSGKEREAIVNDLIVASKMSLQEVKALPSDQEKNIRQLYNLAGSKEMRRFSEVNNTENAIKRTLNVVNRTKEMTYSSKTKKLSSNPDFDPDAFVDTNSEISRRIGQPLLMMGSSNATSELQRPKLAIIGGTVAPNDESLAKKIDEIVKSAADAKIGIVTLEDGTGSLVMEAAVRHNANILLIRENALMPVNGSVSDKGYDAFVELSSSGKLVSASTDITGGDYNQKGDALRLSTMRFASTIADAVIVTNAENKDMAVYAAATAGQHPGLDKNAGKSVAVIIPDVDVKNIDKYAGNFALARENGYVTVKSGVTSTTAFSHSTGGVTDANTGLFVDAIREQKTSPWSSPTFSTTSWSSPAVSLDKASEIAKYVNDVAEGKIQPMQPSLKTGLTIEAIRLANTPTVSENQKVNEAPKEIIQVYSNAGLTPDSVKKTPDATGVSQDWKAYIKNMHDTTKSSMRINERKKTPVGMEI